MKAGGYHTAQVASGTGMATYDHTPHGRLRLLPGYFTTTGLLERAGRQRIGRRRRRRWPALQPATTCGTRSATPRDNAHEHGAGIKARRTCTTRRCAPAVNGSVSDYEDFKLAQATLPSAPGAGDVPLFINHDFHIVHELPQVRMSTTRSSCSCGRLRGAPAHLPAMVHFMDAVGNITY